MSAEETGAGTIVFLGRRTGATAAAKALGVRVLSITEGATARPKPRRWTHSFSDPHAVAALAPALEEAARAGGGRVDAVVALTERAVLPAARLRDALGLQGLSIESSLRCTDKLVMKRAVAAAGIACADFVSSDAGLAGAALVERLGLPLVTKARASSGSRGTTIVRSAADLPAVLPPTCLAESFVSGTEMSVESLVVGGRVVFENPTEYFRPAWANILPAALDTDTWERVRSVNRRAIEALGVMDGITHCEVFLTSKGVVFGELAARPPGGHIMELIRRAYDFDPWEALLRIALGDSPSIPGTAARHAGVWLLHPGPGTISDVRGIDTARAMPGVVDLPFRGAVGDDVATRVGVGQEMGHVTVVAVHRDEVASRLLAAHDTVRITLRGSG